MTTVAIRTLGVLVAAVAIAAAIYLGVWVMLVGGIIAVVHGFQASPVNAGQIAWGAVRVVLCETPAFIAYGGILLAGLSFATTA